MFLFEKQNKFNLYEINSNKIFTVVEIFNSLHLEVFID